METIINSFIATHPTFTTDEFNDMIRTQVSSIGRTTVFNILKDLCEAGIVFRTHRGHYAVTLKKEYFYVLSDTAKEVSSAIRAQFPLVNFQLWELYQMNEFVNHQIAKNTIFVDVENMLDESAFHLLFGKYSHVLYNPSMQEYNKYAGDETIIVNKLISETPPSFGEYKQASLEKILVDLFGRGVSGSIVPHSEYTAIFQDSFQKYNINQAKLFRYARRRGVEQKIVDFLHNDIVLEAQND